MSLVLNVDPVPSILARPRPARVPRSAGDFQPVFVDTSGRRARWCQRFLAVGTLVALSFVLTIMALAIAFTRSTPGPSGRATAAADPPMSMVRTSAPQWSASPAR
jgi:hypothetical protein